MIALYILTYLSFFPASYHLIGVSGSPLEVIAGDTGGGSEDFAPDVGLEISSEPQSEDLPVELNPVEKHSFDLTLRVGEQLLPIHLVKDGTAVVVSEIFLPGQDIKCTAGLNEVAETFVDPVAQAEGYVISKIADGKMSRFFILQFRHMDRVYSLESRASELTGCRDMKSPTESHLKGTFTLYGKVHYLFDSEPKADDESGSSGTTLLATSTSTSLPTTQTITTSTHHLSTLAPTTSPLDPVMTTTSRPLPPPPPPTYFFFIVCLIVGFSCLLAIIAMVVCCKECRKLKQCKDCKEPKCKEKCKEECKEVKETPKKR